MPAQVAGRGAVHGLRGCQKARGFTTGCLFPERTISRSRAKVEAGERSQGSGYRGAVACELSVLIMRHATHQIKLLMLFYLDQPVS